ncbi:MAG: hypothetical protein L6R39_002705 [Caloplaca ligustica]|nr:MAG: hypothetical protein L6R39_002705 [Caloplaca ligustica]
MFSFHFYVLLVSYFVSLACCLPVDALAVSNATRLSQVPDLSPLIYHIPGTSNTLYILPYDFPLPPEEFISSIHGARIYIAHKIAVGAKIDTPLPPDQDPFVYGLNLGVKISWRSIHGKRFTWTALGAAIRGLDDCLVKNNHLPYVVAWHVYDGGQEIGRGVIGIGRGIGRVGTITQGHLLTEREARVTV